MELRRKKWEGYLFSLLLIGAGLLFFFLQQEFASWLFSVLAFIFLGYSSYQLWQHFRQGYQGSLKSAFPFFFNLLLGLFLMNNAFIPVDILAWFVTVEFFAMGIFLLIDYSLKRQNHSQPSLLLLLDGLGHLILGMIVLLHLEDSLALIYSLMGISILFRGLSIWRDTWRLDKNLFAHQGRKKRLALPVFLSALIPISALKAINRLLSPEKSQPILLDGAKEEKPSDLEVWIHTARRGFEMMGHVDISYQGYTYAYGLYDADSRHLFGTIGDGVLIRLDSEDYLASLAQDDWRAVVGYGLVLTDEQKMAVEKRLAELRALTQPFYLTTGNQKADYLGQLSQQYEVKSYKFTRSQFKTYFVMTTNCVLLADTILEVIGTDNVANHGILTPGIYQDYFEREYQRTHSAVVRKFVLGKQEIERET